MHVLLYVAASCLTLRFGTAQSNVTCAGVQQGACEVHSGKPLLSDDGGGCEAFPQDNVGSGRDSVAVCGPVTCDNFCSCDIFCFNRIQVAEEWGDGYTVFGVFLFVSWLCLSIVVARQAFSLYDYRKKLLAGMAKKDRVTNRLLNKPLQFVVYMNAASTFMRLLWALNPKMNLGVILPAETLPESFRHLLVRFGQIFWIVACLFLGQSWNRVVQQSDMKKTKKSMLTQEKAELLCRILSYVLIGVSLPAEIAFFSGLKFGRLFANAIFGLYTLGVTLSGGFYGLKMILLVRAALTTTIERQAGSRNQSSGSKQQMALLKSMIRIRNMVINLLILGIICSTLILWGLFDRDRIWKHLFFACVFHTLEVLLCIVYIDATRNAVPTKKKVVAPQEASVVSSAGGIQNSEYNTASSSNTSSARSTNFDSTQNSTSMASTEQSSNHTTAVSSTNHSQDAP